MTKMSDTAEAKYKYDKNSPKVEQRVLEVVLKALHEVLLLLAVIRNIGRGVASKRQKTITILRDRHSPLK